MTKQVFDDRVLYDYNYFTPVLEDGPGYNHKVLHCGRTRRRKDLDALSVHSEEVRLESETNNRLRFRNQAQVHNRWQNSTITAVGQRRARTVQRSI